MHFQPGDVIGDYEILSVLGAGGMGKVYKVRNVISDRIEAMKVLLPDLLNDTELADRFLREIKVQASLEHPNIAALRTALRAENQLLMVMEYVEGTTLVEMLERGPIPLANGIDYMCQALSALGYAHERGVIHRDIKPANMMLTPDGVLKLMDFGIAKAAADRKLTMTGTTMGSLYYMSPEQVRGATSLDARSDLYSLGVTLYEVVTGTRPFKGDSDYAIMSAHLEKAPAPPIEIDPHLPAALNEIILKAIEKEPERRFQNANALRVALESVKGMLGEPAAQDLEPQRRFSAQPSPAAFQHAPPPPAADTRPAPSRRGLYMLAGSVLTLVLLIAAGFQAANWRRAKAGGSGWNISGAAPQTVVAPQPVAPPPDPAPAAPTPAPIQQAEPAAPEQRAKTPAATGAKLNNMADVLERLTPEQRAKAPAARGPAAAADAPQNRPPISEPPARTPAAGKAASPEAAASAPPAQAPAIANPAAFQEQRERMISLAARANAVRAGMASIERQQQAAGLGMRADMAAARERMQYLLGEANAALAARDAESAKRNMDLAERDIEKLEGFLGK
jgi:hypothetical protein